MKNFFIAVGKAACYVILFLVAQYAVSAAYIYGALALALIRDSSILYAADPTAINTLIEQITLRALANQNLIYLVSAVLTVGMLTLFFRMRKKRLLQEVWAIPVRPVSLWPVVLAGIFFPLLICYGISYIPWPESALSSYDELYNLTNDYSLLAVFTTVIAAPILEEIVYRGLVFTRLCRGMPALAAAILTSTVFGAMHGTLVWAAYAFVGSLALLFIYTKYRSLYASILFHMLFNLVGGFLVSYIPNLGTGFDLLMIAVSFTAVAVLAAVIWRMPRRQIDKPQT
mgnify:CR=1 FL=1